MIAMSLWTQITYINTFGVLHIIVCRMNSFQWTLCFCFSLYNMNFYQAFFNADEWKKYLIAFSISWRKSTFNHNYLFYTSSVVSCECDMQPFSN